MQDWRLSSKRLISVEQRWAVRSTRVCGSARGARPGGAANATAVMIAGMADAATAVVEAHDLGERRPASARRIGPLKRPTSLHLPAISARPGSVTTLISPVVL